MADQSGFLDVVLAEKLFSALTSFGRRTVPLLSETYRPNREIVEWGQPPAENGETQGGLYRCQRRKADKCYPVHVETGGVVVRAIAARHHLGVYESTVRGRDLCRPKAELCRRSAHWIGGR